MKSIALIATAFTATALLTGLAIAILGVRPTTPYYMVVTVVVFGLIWAVLKREHHVARALARSDEKKEAARKRRDDKLDRLAGIR